jgi:hypothetical protein
MTNLKKKNINVRCLKFVLIILLTFYFDYPAYAKYTIYPVSDIPKQLLNGASAVVRSFDISVDVVSFDKVVITRHYMITILSRNAIQLAHISEPFSIINRIDSISAAIYDGKGRLLEKINQDRFKKSLLVSSRGREECDLQLIDLPASIELTCVTVQNTTFVLPAWQPVFTSFCSLENSSFTVTTSSNFNLRYFIYGHPEITKIIKNERITYKWSIHNLPCGSQAGSSIFLAPSHFTLGNYNGVLTTWDDLGKFFYRLNEGRDSLPSDIKLQVNAVCNHIPDTVQKIRTLFTYLLSTTKYIGYEDGILGWQTATASTVLTSHIADCKGLCNYMHALLKENGINSFFVHIKAGYNCSDVNTGFPSQQFNHVILLIPLKSGNYWLDCTDPDTINGCVTNYINDRNGLLIGKNEGILIKTPVK